MTNITFHTTKEGFYNETIKELVAKKSTKLNKFSKDEYHFKHKIRKNGDHKLELNVSDKHTKAEHHNFETALIEVVSDMERRFRKEKEQRLDKKRQPKQVASETETEVFEDEE